MSKPQLSRRFLAIGQIAAAHGIRGEVRVTSLTDFPQRFKPGQHVWLADRTETAEAVPAVIVASRPHKEHMLVKLNTTPDRNAAELLRDLYLLIPEEDAMPLAEHENYIHDLVGMLVVTEAGMPLGEITEVLLTGANDVYVVTGAEGREVLIPARRETVLAVDVEGRRMTVTLPEGLLD